MSKRQLKIYRKRMNNFVRLERDNNNYFLNQNKMSLKYNNQNNNY